MRCHAEWSSTIGRHTVAYLVLPVLPVVFRFVSMEVMKPPSFHQGDEALDEAYASSASNREYSVLTQLGKRGLGMGLLDLNLKRTVGTDRKSPGAEKQQAGAMLVEDRLEVALSSYEGGDMCCILWSVVGGSYNYEGAIYLIHLL
ncbi:hypothetical protein PVK06_014450 [Gossypium arboreum]|uniref:Uncharacterized protein n=1 Tax=Gossypium arboreum TaxID=29729 RepID=A0ABR0PUJ8_GOSAR|nr:hypothetical protein PVK06_014450 [Gossypium arboreum]